MTPWIRLAPHPDRPRTSLLVWFAAWVLLLAGSLGTAQDTAATEELVERGRALYVEHRCGACHALQATGSQGFFAPAHDAMAIIAGARIADPNYSGEADTAAEYVRESIVDPRAYVVPGFAFTRHPMPAYDLPEEDLDELVAFLMDQDGSGGTSP